MVQRRGATAVAGLSPLQAVGKRVSGLGGRPYFRTVAEASKAAASARLLEEGPGWLGLVASQKALWAAPAGLLGAVASAAALNGMDAEKPGRLGTWSPELA